MAFSNVVFFTWIWLFRTLFAETLINPPNEREYHCGINENCTIICNADFVSCADSTFYLYNHHINIQCIGDSSCTYFTKIISINATSINITATGESSLWFAEVIIDSPNTNVYTNCDGYQACRWTAFYYRTQGTVTHICAGYSGCTGGKIHAMSSIELQCHNEQHACGHMSVIWPTDVVSIQKSKLIHYVNNIHITRTPRYLYLANTQIAPNITCIKGCDTFEIAIIYGIKFDRLCVFNDSSCIPQILAHNESFDVSLLNNDFYPSYRNGDYTFSQNTILSIHRYDSHWMGGFIDHTDLPTYINFISDNDSFISILCTECHEMTLNFSSVSNSAITAVDYAKFLIIDGPKNSVTTNIIYGSAAILNVRYHLEKTNRITFNGLPELWDGGCGSVETFCGSEIYLANQSNVDIKGFLRKEDDCCGDDEEVTIFSEIGSQIDVENHGWNIQCHINDVGYCAKFKFYPTLAPTLYPTLPTLSPIPIPTLYPTLTTNHPSQFPSFSPTLYTQNPTNGPSFVPTLSPSSSLEHVTTIGAMSDTRSRHSITLGDNSHLYVTIWILAALLFVSLIAFVVYLVYLFKKKNRKVKQRRKSDHVELGEIDDVDIGDVEPMNVPIEVGQFQVTPLPKERRECQQNVVALKDDDESDNDLLYGGGETTKGYTTDRKTTGKDKDAQ